MNSVQVTVAQQIVDLGPKLQEKIVGVLVDRELTKQTNVLVQAMDNLATMEKEYGKLKPDLKSFDIDGNMLTESFSQKRLDERKKLDGKITKLTNAINKALEKGDFKDVTDFSKSDKKSGGSEDEGDASGEAPF